MEANAENGYTIEKENGSSMGMSNMSWLPLIIALMATLGSCDDRENDLEISIRRTGTANKAMIGAIAGQLSELSRQINDAKIERHSNQIAK